MSIAENLAAVNTRIDSACARAGRKRGEITLVAVSKTFPAARIEEAIAAGITDVGENRVQEARDKKPQVRAAARWHLIGHLQSNKARDAVALFDLMQTIDSVGLAQKLARAAAEAGRTLDVLLQVNIGSEAQKSGIMPGDVESAANQVRGIAGLHLRGLMAIPPIGTAEQTRPYFHQLRALRDRLQLEGLSMGMSDDFEVAIEEGATIVRVGRAIFGSRG